ncbi:MAG: flagellar basal body P-ring protein FlgI [Phycisphaeraceae bacterium]|nr:flagellar basal body P-ring protein FlgI [Phycisphaeraceae bacterium]
MPRLLTILAALACLAGAAAAQTGKTTVRELTRFADESEFVLRGLGLVIGLSGTGDSGKDLALAQQLAEVFRNSGNPIPDYKALERTKSVALVMVTCSIPPGGARVNDALDVTVSVVGSASSLRGGELFITPLQGPTPGSPLYAMAYGPITLEDPSVPTRARVRMGAKLTRDVKADAPAGRLDLVLDPPFRGYASASQIAGTINDTYFNAPVAGERRIARAVDDRTIRVEVPEVERADPAPFIAEILATPIDVALLRLPARVIVNSATGSIVMTADVRISPVAITHNGLTITTTIPPPVPTDVDPLIDRTRWAGLSAGARPADAARLQDLLTAFKQLDIPPADQITIIQQLAKSGNLHAELIVD